MKRYLPVSILIGIFLLLKLSNVSYRLSDTNIYFYTAYQLTKGNLLYKDIFFTNFPLFPYISVLYFFLTGKSILAYYFTAALEVSITALLLYKVIYKQTRDTLITFSSSALYLFSFIILATSTHQTGVFLASLFAVISYYFFLNNKFFLTGIFIASMLLTKAYFLPILVTYIVYLCAERKLKACGYFILGVFFASSIILLPTLLFARDAFIKDVFVYSLTRSQGIDKTNILWFFLQRDFLLVVTLLTNLLLFRKQLFFALFSFFSIVFVFLYQDIYYLYLNFIVPFITIAFALHAQTLLKKYSIQKMVLPTIIIVITCINILTYTITVKDQQKINDLRSLVQVVEQAKPKAIYGTNDIAPLLAYKSKTPLLHNIVDTNTNIYRKGYLNAKALTKDAAASNTLLIGHGAHYPQAGIDEYLVDEIFDLDLVKKECRLLQQISVYTEDMTNRLSLFSC